MRPLSNISGCDAGPLGSAATWVPLGSFPLVPPVADFAPALGSTGSGGGSLIGAVATVRAGASIGFGAEGATI